MGDNFVQIRLGYILVDIHYFFFVSIIEWKLGIILFGEELI